MSAVLQKAVRINSERGGGGGDGEEGAGVTGGAAAGSGHRTPPSAAYSTAENLWVAPSPDHRQGQCGEDGGGEGGLGQREQSRQHHGLQLQQRVSSNISFSGNLVFLPSC